MTLEEKLGQMLQVNSFGYLSDWHGADTGIDEGLDLYERQINEL